jgi:hypothetical protein
MFNLSTTKGYCFHERVKPIVGTRRRKVVDTTVKKVIDKYFNCYPILENYFYEFAKKSFDAYESKLQTQIFSNEW